MLTMTDLRSMLTRKREERLAGVLDYARAVAAGRDVDADKLLVVLHRSETSDDEFERLVNLVRSRAELRKVASTLPAIQAEVKSVTGRIEMQTAAIEETLRKHEAALAPLRAAHRDATDRLTAAQIADNALSADSNLPKPLLDCREAARRDYHAAEGEASKLEAEIARQRRRAEDAATALEFYGGAEKCLRDYADDDRRNRMPIEAQTHVEDVKGGRHRVAEATKRLPAVTAARDAARDAFDAAVDACRDF